MSITTAAIMAGILAFGSVFYGTNLHSSGINSNNIDKQVILTNRVGDYKKPYYTITVDCICDLYTSKLIKYYKSVRDNKPFRYEHKNIKYNIKTLIYNTVVAGISGVTVYYIVKSILKKKPKNNTEDIIIKEIKEIKYNERKNNYVYKPKY